jgi:hypothetical protein
MHTSLSSWTPFFERPTYSSLLEYVLILHNDLRVLNLWHNELEIQIYHLLMSQYCFFKASQ